MTPSEYERYVASVVTTLNCFRGARIYRNHRFPGVPQPGEYEIDLALEMTLGGVPRFLLVIECKQWSRPVDRPVIQKLAQTRDAIAAHKAAVASLVGISDQAVSVAEANGISLWVIAVSTWNVIMGLTGPDRWELAYEVLKLNLFGQLGIALPDKMSSLLADYVKASRHNRELYPTSSGYEFEISGGSAYPEHYSTPGVNEHSTIWEGCRSFETMSMAMLKPQAAAA